MIDWIIADRNEKIPTGRSLLCYCPGWCNSDYQVAEFNGDEFTYDEQPNAMFDEHVVKWALFLEAE